MTAQKLITLSETEFDRQFTLIKNPFAETGWNGCFFETYGVELEFIRTQNPACIWTFLQGDDGQDLIASGYRFVNRINYLISVEPVPDSTTYEVQFDPY